LEWHPSQLSKLMVRKLNLLNNAHQILSLFWWTTWLWRYWEYRCKSIWHSKYWQAGKPGNTFHLYYCPQAVSSASRTGLLTGCYPNRLGISGALMPYSKVGISSEETTIAQMLKAKGYHTAIYGKWHLGCQKEFLPLQHGFDEYLGLLIPTICGLSIMMAYRFVWKTRPVQKCVIASASDRRKW